MREIFEINLGGNIFFVKNILNINYVGGNLFYRCVNIKEDRYEIVIASNYEQYVNYCNSNLLIVTDYESTNSNKIIIKDVTKEF